MSVETLLFHFLKTLLYAGGGSQVQSALQSSVLQGICVQLWKCKTFIIKQEHIQAKVIVVAVFISAPLNVGL